jgi:hypothetical protein
MYLRIKVCFCYAIRPLGHVWGPNQRHVSESALYMRVWGSIKSGGGGITLADPSPDATRLTMSLDCLYSEEQLRNEQCVITEWHTD